MMLAADQRVLQLLVDSRRRRHCGATAAYTLTDDGEGTVFRIPVGFSGDAGNLETLTGLRTFVVARLDVGDVVWSAGASAQLPRLFSRPRPASLRGGSGTRSESRAFLGEL